MNMVLFRKGMIVAIICLFIITIFVPCIGSNVKIVNNTSDVKIEDKNDINQTNKEDFANSKGSVRDFPQILWWYDLNAPSLGSAAVDDIDKDGNLEIVFGTYFNDEHVYALNAENGTLLWKYNTGGCNDASPAIADVDLDGDLEVVIPASSPYKVYCFNGSTGGVEWSRSTGYPNCIDSPPAVADVDNDGKPEVILGTFYGYVFCLNGENGSICWQKNLGTDSYIQSGPNILDLDDDGQLDVVVAQYSGDCRIYALKGDNASVLWYSDLPLDYMYHGGSFADIDEDGKPEIVIGCYDNHVYVVNCENGSIAWDYTAPYYIAAPTSIADLNNDGHLEIVFASYNIVGALSYNGSLLWSYPTGGSIFRGASIADINDDGTPDVIFGSDDGILRVLSGDNGQEVWTYDLEQHYGNTYNIDHAPVIADFNNDGKLDIFVVGGYASSSPPDYNHGRAYVISAGNGSGPGWPMFRHDLRHSANFEKNQPPVAVDDYASTNKNTDVVVDITLNDYDPDGTIDPTTVNIISDASHGTVDVNPDSGNVTYSPSSNYVGTDSFIYTVDDNDGATSNIAIVNITIIGPELVTNFLQGWNFVSLPFNQSTDLTDLIVHYDEIDYNWTEATNPANGPIVDPNVYGWNRSLDMYVPATTMEPGYGYWMYAYDDCEIWVENITVTPDDFITDLNQKWNSIGIPSLQTTNLSDFIVNYLGADYNWTEATDPVNGPIVDPNVYGWSRILHMYVPVADTLEPGYAYWMYAYQNCTLRRS